MNLSKNFTYQEFIRSSTATRYNIDNSMNEEQTKKAIILCETILQPLRDKIKKSININSGFRCRKLNKKIKGSKYSQHCFGEAVDFIIYDFLVPDICNMIIKMELPFYQLIDEFSNSQGGGWVHVSIAPDGKENKRQFLKAIKNKFNQTIYIEQSL